MSWWVSLNDENGNPVEVQSHSEGGTYVVGGTNEADLNVTYNYGGHFRDAMGGEGIEDLHGKTGGECIAKLRAAVEKLGTDRDRDYWAATPGNAGRALAILLSWAEEHPEATFRVN